jgi:hypothetical protein
MRRLVIAFLLLAACDGSSTTSDGGSNSDSGTLNSPVCPGTAPTVGDPCTLADTATCEYGSAFDPGCNTLAQCVSGKWTKPFGDCTTPPSDPVCPASFSDITAGGTCSPTGTNCSYAEGACYCGACGGGGFPPPADAAPPPTWQCSTVNAGCPAVRPRFGEACTVDAQTCSYEFCTCTRVNLICKDGYWQGTFSEACA